jgi:hypothetical protein
MLHVPAETPYVSGDLSSLSPSVPATATTPCQLLHLGSLQETTQDKRNDFQIIRSPP